MLTSQLGSLQQAATEQLLGIGTHSHCFSLMVKKLLSTTSESLENLDPGKIISLPWDSRKSQEEMWGVKEQNSYICRVRNSWIMAGWTLGVWNLFGGWGGVSYFWAWRQARGWLLWREKQHLSGTGTYPLLWENSLSSKPLGFWVHSDGPWHPSSLRSHSLGVQPL